MAMDKGVAKQVFVAENVPTPKGVVINKSENDYYGKVQNADIDFPCVVKPCCGGSSIGVYIPNTKEEFDKDIELAFGYENQVLVEEYIKGREFSVGVIEGKALPIIEIIPLKGFYDYENKYKPGATNDVCPAQISENVTELMQREAEHAAMVLKLENYSRIDFLMDENENIYCLEANTLPGMTPTSLLPQEAKVLGIDYPDLCEMLINKSINK